MKLSQLEKDKVRESIKNALLQALNNCTTGHYITRSPVTAYVGVSCFEDGEVSIQLVGSMNEIPLYGALEKAKISIREICINNEVENAVSTVMAQIEAASIPPGDRN